MKKKRAAILGIIALVFIGIFLGQELTTFFKVQKISSAGVEKILGIYLAENNDFLQGKEKKTQTENNIVTFENMLLPYDSETNCLYLAQSLEKQTKEMWAGKLSACLEGNYVLYSIYESYWHDKSTAIKEGHIFTVWVVGEKDYYEFQLVISGMPIINITTERMEVQEKVPYEVDLDKMVYGSEDLYYGAISVMNPDVGTERYELVQTNVCYHLKGASTRNFEKKAYSLKLQDSKGKNVDVSLLGMRSDNNWKLNALNTDANRIREITASKIWEQIDETNTSVSEPGPRMEYVELVLDNRYCGLYCLVEPVDEKKLALDENDVLYKVIDWEVPEDEAIWQSIEHEWKIAYPIRVRYPKTIDNYETAWHPMRDYLNYFYRQTGHNYEVYEAKVDVGNVSDMFIFLMTTNASDNNFKNLYYAAYTNTDGTYKMLQIPWDLDYTFGNVYQYDVLNNVAFTTTYESIFEETAVAQLKFADRLQMKEQFISRWDTYRAGCLSTEAILQLLEDNQTYIAETGAIAREMERWPDAAVSLDIEQLKAFQINRMEWLDEYFIKWVNE